MSKVSSYLDLESLSFGESGQACPSKAPEKSLNQQLIIVFVLRHSHIIKLKVGIRTAFSVTFRNPDT